MVIEQSPVGLTVFGLSVWAVLEQLHPGAAMGASFGCIFFIFLPDPGGDHWVFKLTRKVGLTVFSWGIGYATGTFAGGDGAMFAAVLGGALGAVVMGAFNLMVKNDAPLPGWLDSLLKLVLRLKTRGNDEQ